MEILEYIIALRGARVAAAEVQGLAGEFTKLGAAQARAGAESGVMGGRMRGAMGLVGGAAKVAAVAVVGVGLEATKMAVNFNHEMLRIRTDAGASTGELARMKKGVLDLAASGQSMGQGPMSLAAGLYHLESLNIRGSKALQALKLASHEAAISGADLEQTTTAIGAAMYVGIKGTSNLTNTMGTLNAIVGAGNMRFQNLNEALGTGLLGSAKIAGLSLSGVGAALAVLTDAGYPASSAAAQMGTALHFLYAPTTKATAALKSVGMTGTQMALDLHKPNGLFVALKDLQTHLKGLSDVQRAQVLNAILPGGRGRVLLMELQMLDRLKGKYEQINRTAGGFQGSVNMQKKDPGTQLKIAEAGLQASMIRLGNVLLPIVVPALTALANAGSKVVQFLSTLPHLISGVIGWFSNLGGGVHTVVREINGAPRLVTVAFKGATGPIADFLRFAIRTFGQIGKTISDFWKKTVKPAFDSIGNEAHKVFNGSFLRDVMTIGKALLGLGKIFIGVFVVVGRPVINAFATIVRGAFRIVAGVVKIVASVLNGDLSGALQGVGQVASGVVTGMIGIFKLLLAPIGLVKDALTWLWQNVMVPIGNFIGSVFKPALDVVGAAFQAILTAINAILGPLQTLMNGLSSVANSVLSLAQNGGGAVGAGNNSIGTAAPGSMAPSLGQQTPTSPTSGAGASPRPVTHGVMMRPGSAASYAANRPVVVAHTSAAGWHHGDLVIKVGHHEFVRVLGHTMREQMARGA